MTSIVMMLRIVVVLIALSFPATSGGDLAPQPAYCCPLVLQNHAFNDPLPKDMVFAPPLDGKRWGYGVSSTLQALVISEDRKERPTMIKLGKCIEHKETEFAVLTNPNRCSIGWYKTRYDGERLL